MKFKIIQIIAHLKASLSQRDIPVEKCCKVSRSDDTNELGELN